VTVSFSAEQTGFLNDRFIAHLTITNAGRATVANWELRLSLPGDRIEWVGYPGGFWGQSFANWAYDGTLLRLSADSGGEALAPGATEVVPIFGHGTRTSPAGCTFDGAACRSSGSRS
jgi:hypothetical protein